MIKEYTIVSSNRSYLELVEIVNSYIQSGWQPVGSMTNTLGTGHIWFYQTMVKYEQV